MLDEGPEDLVLWHPLGVRYLGELHVTLLLICWMISSRLGQLYY
jgi:hypothetical protein